MLLTSPIHGLAAQVKSKALELGFDLVAITDAGPSTRGDYFRRWLAGGQAGEMDYLAQRVEERIDPAAYFPGVRSIICVAMNYHVPLERIASDDRANLARIARYALGDDYHELIKPRLHGLADWLRETVPGSQTRVAVDTAPVMEKDLAARAGVGWLGKNTCIINPEMGSWLFLGEVLTTVVLPPDSPISDHCGTCTRCIDACPTQAITAAYQLDARKCISYLTIEHRGEIAGDLQSQVGEWLYGCDICQDVCPFNSRAPEAQMPELQPRFASGAVDAAEVQGWDAIEYQTTLRGSAMKRVKLPMLQRNARIVAKNLACDV